MSEFIFSRIIGFMLTVITFIGCAMDKPVKADFVGTWTSKDGGLIVLNEDSTCLVKMLDMARLNDYSEESFASFDGKWYIRAQDDLGHDEYNIVIRQDSLCIYEPFIVSGQGLLKNRSPWYFFQYIGDPDNLDEYRFVKTE
ncbi:hypothetical protein [Bacteroides acidifaciens]|uniref:hypothetical protein n=1 Tax=Bacteroides acidifaciens TaxID=85831 RepID=UPI00158E4568|nr:hypothetical protein [Bacteroides acidifaciens]